MKAAALVTLLAALATVPAHAATLGLDTHLSPVTRVVELLKGLSKNIDIEAKKEEDLFESFVCWGKSVIEQKSASNEEAESRIEELTQYIADIEAGRIEFTSERVDLEKEIKDLSDGIEESTRMREQEHKDFIQAEKEMTQAVAALKKAIDVLGDATKGHETGVFLAMDSKQGMKLGLEEGFAQRVEDATALTEAAHLGEKFLSQGDALFLKRLLVGEVPDVDWKKLNRKANFKKSYKARSFKIQSVLQKLESTFSDNLSEAQDKESEAQESFDTLNKAKNEQLDKAQESLRDMSKENGARGLTKQESQDEVDALTEQVANDKKFIEQTKTDLAEKKVEWKDRSELRAGETAAIAKAVGILYSDDSRDLFKKSHESQAMLFLQEGQTRARGSRAAALLQKAARLAGDQRLIAVSTIAAQMGGHFDEVIKAVNTMIDTLKSEEASDLEAKEACEKERMEDSRNAIKGSRAIDEMSDLITKLSAEIEELKRQTEENNVQIAEINKQVEEATKNREREAEDWAISDKEDKEAAQLVESAKGVLETFYQESGLMSFAQIRAPEVSAGKAPPPPPSTWEAPYGGKTEESTSIISMLEIVKEDIEKDTAKAAAEETAAIKSFGEFTALSDTQLLDLASANKDMESSIGDKLGEIETTKESRGSEKDQLDAVLKNIKDSEPGCNYATINYSIRASNRDIEIDGLVKAKAILQGGSFK